jgi:phosphate transport system substrate-binding protein
MTKTRNLAALIAVLALATTAAACGDDNNSGGGSGGSSGGGTSAQNLSGKLAGAGSSAQQAAMQAWTSGIQSGNSGLTVSYDPVGSGGGREQFGSGGVQFAGSDSAAKEEDLANAQKRCGGPDNFVEVPVYISAIAVAYNLDGVDNLQLSPETLAKIMAGKITKWNDPAIKADNPDAQLPGDRINTVHRSDKSGTTKNFTDYMAKTASSDWTNEADDVWPLKGGEAAQGTSGVVDALKNGKGSIGYADESQVADPLKKAKIKVGSAFVEPSAAGATKDVELSKQSDEDKGKYVYTLSVERKPTDSAAYPITLVSYQLACTSYKDAAQGKNVKGLLSYIISDKGQQAAAQNAGSAPLPASVRQKIQPFVEAIGSGSGGQ